jgi:hypothetical protein
MPTPTVILTGTPTPTGPNNDLLYSPNRQWRVEKSSSDTLKIVQVDGKISWLVSFLGKNAKNIYRIAAWSQDGNYVYIDYTIGSQNDQISLSCKTNGIRRLDLRDGTLVPFLEFGSDKNFECWNYAFSQNALKLAYIQPSNPKILVVVDINSGERLEYQFDRSYTEAGLIQWSSDQKQLIVIAGYANQSRGIITNQVLFWGKIGDNTLTVHEVFSQPGFLSLREWQGDRVLIEQSFRPPKVDTLLEVRLSSQSIIPIKPTAPAIVQTDLPNATELTWEYSPNGQWLVEGLYTYSIRELNGPGLLIVRTDGKVKWKVDFLGSRAYYDYHSVLWSEDGNFAYIGYQIGHGDVPVFSYCMSEGLSRLDLRDGSIVSFPFEHSRQCWDYLWLSNYSKIAYITPGQSKQLVVLDIDSGKKVVQALDESYYVMKFYWSERQQILAVATRAAETEPGFESVLIWIKMDGERLVVEEVFSYAGYFVPIRWNGNRVIVCPPTDPSGGAPISPSEKISGYWAIDLDTKNAVKVDPAVELKSR